SPGRDRHPPAGAARRVDRAAREARRALPRRAARLRRGDAARARHRHHAPLVAPVRRTARSRSAALRPRGGRGAARRPRDPPRQPAPLLPRALWLCGGRPSGERARRRERAVTAAVPGHGRGGRGARVRRDPRRGAGGRAMTAVRSVDLVIPVYNEEPTLPRLFERLDADLSSLAIPWRAIFVDDGSRDGSWRLLEEAARRDRRFTAI